MGSRRHRLSADFHHGILDCRRDARDRGADQHIVSREELERAAEKPGPDLARAELYRRGQHGAGTQPVARRRVIRHGLFAQ